MLTPFFTARPVHNYEDATRADTTTYARFFRGMLARGIYPPPSQFEAWFLSGAHTTRHIDQAIDAARATLRAMRRGRGTRRKETGDRPVRRSLGEGGRRVKASPASA